MWSREVLSLVELSFRRRDGCSGTGTTASDASSQFANRPERISAANGAALANGVGCISMHARWHRESDCATPAARGSRPPRAWCVTPVRADRAASRSPGSAWPPHRVQIGGADRMTAVPAFGADGRRVGWSSGSLQVPHEVASSTARSASSSSRVMTGAARAGAPGGRRRPLRRFFCGGHLLCVAPESFQPVERAGLRREHVHDEIEVVEEDPFRAVVAFDVRGLFAFGSKRVDHAVGNGSNLSAVRAGADDEVVRESVPPSADRAPRCRSPSCRQPPATASAICLGSLVAFFRFPVLAMQPACREDRPTGLRSAGLAQTIDKVRAAQCVVERDCRPWPSIDSPADSFTRIAVDDTSAVTPSIRMIDGPRGSPSPSEATDCHKSHRSF